MNVAYFIHIFSHYGIFECVKAVITLSHTFLMFDIMNASMEAGESKVSNQKRRFALYILFVFDAIFMPLTSEEEVLFNNLQMRKMRLIRLQLETKELAKKNQSIRYRNRKSEKEQ